MTPVFPYRLRRSKRVDSAELLLQLPDRKHCVTLSLNMEQARALAAEMHGLSTDRCCHHDMVVSIAASFGATITRVVLREVAEGMVVGALRLETESRVIEVDTDVAAALSIAVHRGIPVFASGKRFATVENQEAAQCQNETSEVTEIPSAFHEVIQSLDLPTAEAEELGRD